MLASCISFAQGISVKGVEIEGDIFEFVNKLIEKGLEPDSSTKPLNKAIDEAIQRNSPIYLKGKLMDKSATFKVYYTRTTNKAYKVVVSFIPEFYSFGNAQQDYILFKKRLKEKYGKAIKISEKFLNSKSNRIDGSYSSTFKTGNGDVILSLEDSFRGIVLQISYINSVNSEVNEMEKEALYQEEI